MMEIVYGVWTVARADYIGFLRDDHRLAVGVLDSSYVCWGDADSVDSHAGNIFSRPAAAPSESYPPEEPFVSGDRAA